jgi:hypothetical protein
VSAVTKISDRQDAADEVTGIHAKLVWVRRHVGNVEKSKKNTNLNYQYRTEEDYYSAVRPLLDRVNVMLYASTLGARLESDMFIVEMEYTLVDCDSGESVTVRTMGAGDATTTLKDGRVLRDSTGLKKATTGAARYFFQKCFLVADGTDDEEDVGSGHAPRANALTVDQAREIERLAAAVGIAADDASQKATGMPVSELTAAQATRLVGLLLAKQRQQQRDAEAQPAPPSRPDPVARSLSELLTPKQVVAIRAIANAAGRDAEKVCEAMFGCRPEALTKTAASALLDALKADVNPKAEPDEESEPPAEALEAFHAAVDREPDPDPQMPDEPLVSVPFSYTGFMASGRALRQRMLTDLLASIEVDAKAWLRDTKGLKKWTDASDGRLVELVEEAIRLERDHSRVSPETAADLISAISEKKISRAAITAKIRPSFKQFDQLSKREADELFVWLESAHSAG